MKGNNVPAGSFMPAACCFVFGKTVSGLAESHIDLYLLAAGRDSRLLYRRRPPCRKTGKKIIWKNEDAVMV
uniref:Putative orf protein n=1 Tax=Bacillus subtilis TaxID=1423 RepID=Q798N8_BACIU|nr:hypothetical protein yitX - Bacillus subtilis [Bacillus subtilis]CAA70635.1 YitX [Bacillus subtilis]CAB01839.1 putative orf [Bacillus subtilis]